MSQASILIENQLTVISTTHVECMPISIGHQKKMLETKELVSYSILIVLLGLMTIIRSAEGLSGRVLDQRPRVCASSASLRCILEQDTLILA